MIVHYLLFLITVAFSKMLEKTGKPVKLPDSDEEENRTASIAGFIAYVPVIIFYGLCEIGDSGSYVVGFNKLEPQGVFDSLSDRNPGYSILQNVVKMFITDNGNTFVLILTMLSIIFLTKTFSRYSPIFVLSTFVLFGSTEISYVFNGARQFLAISIMLYTLKFAEEKKLIKYIIFSVIAFSIHQTAIIVIPAFFIANGKFLNIKIIIAGLVTIFATAFSSLFIDYVNDMFISDSVYSQYYDTLVEGEGVNIFRVLVASVPVILCLVYKKRIDELDDPILNYCANMSTLALAVSVFSATSGGEILGRLAEYYLIYNTLTYPMLLKRVVSKNVRGILTAGLVIGYFIFYWYQFSAVWEIGYRSKTLGISIGMKEV